MTGQAPGAPSTFTLLRRNFWLFFGSIFVVAGLLTTIIGLGMAWQESRFGSEGRSVVGTVLGKSIDPGDRDEGTRYFVQYRFTDADGNVRDGSDQVGFAVYDTAREGGPIDVQFIPDDPGTNRVATDDSVVSWIILAVAVLALAIGIAVALSGLRTFRRERRLWRDGTSADAEVTSVEETNVRVNRRQMWRVRYRFADASGSTHEGASGYLGWDEVRDLRSGDRGSVRYDPRRPGESIWVGGPAPLS